MDALRASSALNAWRSAGDCFPLDRLWYAIEGAGFVELRSTRARPRHALPITDEEWVDAGLRLALGLAVRAGSRLVDPLDLLVEHALDGEVSASAVCDGWVQELPQSIKDVIAEDHRRDFTEMLYVFGDTGLLRIDGDRVSLTALGELFVAPLRHALANEWIDLQ